LMYCSYGMIVTALQGMDRLGFYAKVHRFEKMFIVKL